MRRKEAWVRGFWLLAVVWVFGCGSIAPGHELGDSLGGHNTQYPSIPASCGNGALDAGETCDDGGESATCDIDCTPAECGDARPNATAGEDCDTAGDSEECDADCTFVECGDDYVNPVVEACESQGQDRATCDADCTAVECGDGYANAVAYEACDDGEMTADCDDDCTLALCGDSTLNTLAGEICDGGWGGSADCDTDCTLPECGDGVANQLAGEDCDDGNLIDGDGCDANCSAEMPPVCLQGNDPNTGDPWVVCEATATTVWVSHAYSGGGTYNMDLICASLGYPNITANGGTCGDVCGYCETGPTSCNATGNRNFDGSNGCAFPQACSTVMWECSL